MYIESALNAADVMTKALGKTAHNAALSLLRLHDIEKYLPQLE
jgi:hypothetical protein